MSDQPLLMEAWYYSVAKLDLYKENDYIDKSGTGFFYKHNEEIHLITCRHVITNEEKEHYPDVVKIKVHTSTTTNLENRIIEIKLYDENQNPLWLKSDNLEVDIVCINIQEYIEPPDVIVYWLSHNILSDRAYFPLGERVVVLGYPKQYHDRYHNLPIGRTGFIASVFGSNFDDHPYFLIDAVLHPGTSGSPVLRPTGPLRFLPEGGYVGGNTPMLVGVNSGEQEIIKDKTRLGLHRVIYANYIEDILSQGN